MMTHRATMKKIRKLLIAKRSEIAIRAICAATLAMIRVGMGDRIEAMDFLLAPK
jgi:pyruvate carboxylase